MRWILPILLLGAVISRFGFASEDPCADAAEDLFAAPLTERDTDRLHELSRRAQQGDVVAQNAIGNVVAEAAPRILRSIARKYGRTLVSPELDELASGVFFSVVRGNYSFDRSRSTFPSWLFLLCNTEINRRWKKKNQKTERLVFGKQEGDGENQSSLGETLGARAQDNTRHEPIAQQLAGLELYERLLPDKTREIFQKFHHQRVPADTLAAERGISGQAIRNANTQSAEWIARFYHLTKMGVTRETWEKIASLPAAQRDALVRVAVFQKDLAYSAQNLGIKRPELVALLDKASRTVGLPAKWYEHEDLQRDSVTLLKGPHSAQAIAGTGPIYPNRREQLKRWEENLPSIRDHILDSLTADAEDFDDGFPLQASQLEADFGFDYPKFMGTGSYGQRSKPYSVFRGPDDFRLSLLGKLKQRREQLNDPEASPQTGSPELERLDDAIAALEEGRIWHSPEGRTREKRLQSWAENKDAVANKTVENLLSHIMETGTYPHKFNATQTLGVNYGRIVAEKEYGEGMRNEAFRVFDSAEAFKVRWSEARKQKISELESLAQIRALTPEEEKGLTHLREHPPLETTRWGLPHNEPKEPVDLSDLRLNAWREERPKAKAESVDRLIEFAKAQARLPETQNEVSEIAGHGYNKLVGLSQYAPGKSNGDYSVFESPAQFRAAWILARETELSRLDKKREAQDLTPLEATQLENLRNTEPANSRDGVIALKSSAVRQNAQNELSRKNEIQDAAIKSVVEFAVSQGRLPLAGTSREAKEELKAITGVNFNKLVAQGDYSVNQPQEKYAIFSSRSELTSRAWQTIQKEIESLEALGLNASEAQQQRLTQLKRIPRPSRLPRRTETIPN